MKNLLKMAVVALGLFSLSFAYSYDFNDYPPTSREPHNLFYDLYDLDPEKRKEFANLLGCLITIEVEENESILSAVLYCQNKIQDGRDWYRYIMDFYEENNF